MSQKHAVLSPSSAHRWSLCTAAPYMERDKPNTDSDASKTGTAAHELAAMLLTGIPEQNAVAFTGRKMTNGVEVTEKMAEDVQGYVDYIRTLAKNAQFVLIEHPVDIAHITGEKDDDGNDAEGTADCIMLMHDGELIVSDYKNGYREVNAEYNKQLAMYASGAKGELELLYDITGIRTVVYQPSGGGAKEYKWTSSEFHDLIDGLTASAQRATAALKGITMPVANPGPKQCEWCKAKTDCKAHQNFIEETTGVKFEEITDDDVKVPVPVSNLGRKLDIVPMLRSLCDAIEATAHIELQAGREVLGADGPYKLVKDKAGPRAWVSKEEAEAMLKGMRLPQNVMYDLSLISPTTAEKLAKKEVIGKKQWTKIQTIITRADGKPRVANAKDKGEAIKIQTEEEMFTPIED